jgi:hypothetical protein
VLIDKVSLGDVAVSFQGERKACCVWRPIEGPQGRAACQILRYLLLRIRIRQNGSVERYALMAWTDDQDETWKYRANREEKSTQRS